MGTDWPILGIILPIGISFFTFTQIAFLADAYAGKVTEYRFIYYVLFVTYFPHLIAGPVLHHKEMMPQFDEDRNYRPDAANFAIGLTIFAIGLAKKVLIADNLAGYAAPAFAPGADPPTLFFAWGGALAYTFQLYFDFSGYSDMAIGLSRIFGVRFPLNFSSPYKSHNIAEFWRRWHMTLSRFLRDYLYIPLKGNRHGTFRRQTNLITTLVLGGLWHGAGWNFVIWGGLHGGFLVINQLWQNSATELLSVCLLNLADFLALPLPSSVLSLPGSISAPLTSPQQIASLPACSEVLELHCQSRSCQARPTEGGCEDLGIRSYSGGGAIFVEIWRRVAIGGLIPFLPQTLKNHGAF